MDKGSFGCTVRVATSEDEFDVVRAVRAAAYGHHEPELGPRFGQADPLDHAEGATVMVCRDTRSGRGIGTLRVHTSAFGPLALEDSVSLPSWLAQRPRAQISRLAVCPGAPGMVKLSLMKASYQYCLAMQVRWMVIGARNAALIRNYRGLGFKDVFEPGAWVPLASGGGLPHQILAFDVVGAKQAWQAARNRLYGFMTDTGHVDVRLPAANDDSDQLQPAAGTA